ncbi:hypothetical protein KAFR_0L01820 [Kazachstania africana CBS 2517]|uniref:Glutamyl-tRNA(Gln) amidotransferase subunit B, mitochondrial n=1 Tax=Kazachstania africana (strain ATCC 22294 / BCRC 22015 / CBS 2517 / CECT 1963 / NBRC 1671 / NRRL Y-8276) TaxID=1071382 RepID=H2B2E2_KAZAF|nr:hypothetical protein KAFR_0L01820 [Kazachstania africana CBS 2517]CCF60792.1 hypothetical protein KAFR_0L01820 [Kazachstania africana CBS 2517]
MSLGLLKQSHIPIRRLFSTIPGYNLKCGLEIHTQLNTENKLFSRSRNDPFRYVDQPNVNASYFDVALPGSRPTLNYEVVLYALKLALAMNSTINLNSQFDRKHYFYGDLPQGYQITQHYRPIATGGQLTLSKPFDDISSPSKAVNIKQLQIEQDTGRSVYLQGEGLTLIDLNRANVPLIELVTEPDLTSIKEVRAFLKKYQDIVRQLKISTGDLETGSVRVDVNINVNEYPRVELKNLPNTSSIINAIKYEYKRQVNIIQSGKAESELREVETRRWDGEKHSSSDLKSPHLIYRYMPDPELPYINLDKSIVADVAKTLPKLSDEVLDMFMNEPYNLSLKDARILTMNHNLSVFYTNEEIKDFYLSTFQIFSDTIEGESSSSKIVINWVLHELLGTLNKLGVALKESREILSPQKFAEFLLLIYNRKISNSNAKLLLFHLIENIKDYKENSNLNLVQLTSDLELDSNSSFNDAQLQEQCRLILKELDNSELVDSLVSGKKKNTLQYLVGQGMRKFHGKVEAQELQKTFKNILNIKW